MLWTGNAWQTAASSVRPALSCTLDVPAGSANVTWKRSAGFPTGVNLPDGAYSLSAAAYDSCGFVVKISISFKKATLPALETSDSSATRKMPLLQGSESVVFSDSITLNLPGVTVTLPENFRVIINGTATAVQDVQLNENTVALYLPDGALLPGDQIVVTWQGLHDAMGATLDAGIWQGKAE